MDSRLTLKCSCGHAILEITKDSYKHTDENGADLKTTDYYLSFYHYSSSDNSFWLRLKKAWKYFAKGEKILLDDIVLNEIDVEKLVTFVKEK